MSSNIRVPTVAAQLAASADESFDPDDGPWTISGVAVGEDNVLHTPGGRPILFDADALSAGAGTMVGEPVTVDHPTDDNGEFIYPPPTDETVGKVTDSKYVDGKGVVFAATVHDPEIARGVSGRSYEVSVHPQFSIGDTDDETGAGIASDVEFLDLSVVSRGDSDDNLARLGMTRELAAWANQTDVTEELAATASADEAGSGQQSLISSAVNGTLRALGIEPNDVDTDAASLAAEDSDSDTDTETNEQETMTDREQRVETLTDDHGFDGDVLDSMDDEQIETMHSGLVADGPDGSDAGGGKADADEQTTDESDGGKPVGEMTVGELGDALSENQGFVTEDDTDDIVASAQEADSREELIATITGQTDKSEEALAEWPTDALEDKAQSLRSPAQLPGSTGRHTETVAASYGGDDDDAGYTTGVEGR